MKRLIAVSTLLLTLSVLLTAADVSGTWKGNFDFQGNAVPLQFNLKASGDALSGTVEGLPTTPATIKEGKVSGNTLTFYIETDYQGQTFKLIYKGEMSNDQIKFTFGTEDGSFSAEVVAKRST